MSDCKTNTQCDTTSTSSHNQKEGVCDAIRHMEKLANQAWDELFKEKVKKHYEETIGKKMDENAKIVAEQAIHALKNKMANREAKREYEHKLFAAMKSE
jgi:hypothetical protein